MQNLLTAPVQIIDLQNHAGDTVWYAPQGFPDLETDAEIVAMDGMWLLIFTGWDYRIIRDTQVKRIVSKHSAESTELLDEERADYDAETK